MGRSHYGQHVHRQPWVLISCPHCGGEVRARRTFPGRPWHVRTHLTEDGLCPPAILGETRFVMVPDPPSTGQLALDLDA